MHLDGFIIRIYHDERSPERQIRDYIPILDSPVRFHGVMLN